MHHDEDEPLEEVLETEAASIAYECPICHRLGVSEKHFHRKGAE